MGVRMGLQRFGSVVGLALGTLTMFGSMAAAQEVRPRMVGGEFVPLHKGPVAYIRTTEFECSGVLVGPREILTAAHCISNSLPNTDYGAIVGGDVYEVESRWYNSSYVANGSVVANAPYDLGILILKTPVTGTSPVPVLFNDPVNPGETALIFGYGTNELSGMPDRNPLDNAKAGTMVVAASSGGLISSIHSLGGASTCSGDSGGPAIQVIAGYSAVVGTLSIGVNRVIEGTCFLSFDGSFSYVDLQSANSQAFLRNFAGVSYVSGYRIYVNSIARDAVNKVRKVLKAKSVSAIAKGLAPVLRSLNAAAPFADGTRLAVLKKAVAGLKAASTARTSSTAIRLVRKALADLEGLGAMGVI